MNEYVGVEGASGVLRVVLSDEGKSGATLTVYEGAVRVHVSVWMQRWVGPRYQLMKKALPSLPAITGAVAKDADAWVTALYQHADSIEYGDAPRGSRDCAAAYQRGFGWHVGLPLKELMHPGYRVSRTAIPRSANDALYALGQRALKSGQAKGTFHYVHHGLRACRGQRTTTLLTAAEYTQLVYRRRRAEKGAAAKAASELEVKQRNTLLSPEEEAALTSVLAWAEAETSAEADPAAKGRKQRGIPGISPRCCTQVGLHLGRPDEATRLGLVHSDDPATPTLAVVIGLGPPEREWVPPFFVDMPAGRSYDFESLTDDAPPGLRKRTSIDAAAYDDGREVKWRCVQRSGSNESSRLRMISPSGAVCAETLAPKCPTILSKPVSNRDGPIRYRKGEALTARPGLACGTGVFFDSTCPHRDPGVMAAEGERMTLYLGFQGRSTDRTDGLPVLAHDPSLDTGGKASTDWVPAFTDGDVLNLKTLSRKRRRASYEWEDPDPDGE